jgi:very-short-patch-repair endonuclease
METVAPGAHSEGDPPIEWKGLTFRSWTELRLAKAFEDRGLLYIANARARVGIHPRRETRELDALVNVDGLWVGIEVDGEPFHPPSRSAHEHTRDRLFLIAGVVHVFRYDAREVYQQPEAVAAEIIAITGRIGRSLGRYS